MMVEEWKIDKVVKTTDVLMYMFIIGAIVYMIFLVRRVKQDAIIMLGERLVFCEVDNSSVGFLVSDLISSGGNFSLIDMELGFYDQTKKFINNRLIINNMVRELIIE